jgi:hypothetical protein
VIDYLNFMAKVKGEEDEILTQNDEAIEALPL